MRKATASIIGALLLALAHGVAADPGEERRIGDALSLALPVAALGTELARGDRRGALQFAESFALTVTAAEILKRSTHVERPDGSNDLSFPSGHAARAFAVASYVHGRHGLENAWPLYALATYVGYTRVQAGRHRWVDVLGAAGVAALSAHWLVDPARPGGGIVLRPKGIQLSWSVPLR